MTYVELFLCGSGPARNGDARNVGSAGPERSLAADQRHGLVSDQAIRGEDKFEDAEEAGDAAFARAAKFCTIAAAIHRKGEAGGPNRFHQATGNAHGSGNAFASWPEDLRTTGGHSSIEAGDCWACGVDRKRQLTCRSRGSVSESVQSSLRSEERRVGKE